MKVLLKRLSPEAGELRYAHPGDSGFDLYAAEDAVLKPGARKLVGTGISVAIPKGYEAQVRPKSGLASEHGITVLNTPGTVDSGYRGEIKVILINLGEQAYRVEKGRKIAQLVFTKVEEASIEEVAELDSTSRSGGGFGSTGV